MITPEKAQLATEALREYLRPHFAPGAVDGPGLESLALHQLKKTEGERFGFQVLSESLSEAIIDEPNAPDIRTRVNETTLRKMGPNHWNRIVLGEPVRR